MKIIIKTLGVVLLAIALPAFADGPWVSLQVINAWSGACTETPPQYYTNAKNLADSGHLLDAGEKASLATYGDDDVYTWSDAEDDYIWILFTFANDPEDELEQAWVDWSFWIEEDDDDEGFDDYSHLCYWVPTPGDPDKDGYFQHIGMAEPDSQEKNETWALGAWNNTDAENVTFLIYVYSPGATAAFCDIAQARIQFSGP